MWRAAAFVAAFCYARAMFRTRDFILLFTCIVFLVAAIGVTSLQQWRGERAGEVASVEITASSSDLQLTASVPGDAEEDRMNRLMSMKEKIAASDIFAYEPGTEELEDAVATTSEENEGEPGGGDLLACGTYVPYLGFWDSRGISVEVKEGAVVAEREVDAVVEVVLQLPVRSLPAATPSCISSDVIGVANDGSLIRNDEVALYSIFGSETRIGYALDGFPIYGAGSSRTDVCGGRVSETGQYRYELSADRPVVLNCFAAAPQTL